MTYVAPSDDVCTIHRTALAPPDTKAPPHCRVTKEDPISTTTGDGGGWAGATGGSVSSGAAAPVVIAEPVPTEFTQATSTAYLLAKSTHISKEAREPTNTDMHTRGRSSGSQLTTRPTSTPHNDRKMHSRQHSCGTSSEMRTGRRSYLHPPVKPAMATATGWDLDTTGVRSAKNP